VAKLHAFETGLDPRVPFPGTSQSHFTVDERMKEFHVPGVSVAIIDQGRVFLKGFGELEQDGGKLSQIASISKVVTSLTILSLVKDGRLSLDTNARVLLGEPLWSKIDPEHKTDGADHEVTIRRLLSHTAGIAPERYNLGDYYNVEAIDQHIAQVQRSLSSAGQPLHQELLTKLGDLRELREKTVREHVPTVDDMLEGRAVKLNPIRVASTPGTHAVYSNPGFTILQKIIETVTGQPFPAVVHERVLGPLGMTKSTYSPLIERTMHGNDPEGREVLGSWSETPELAAGGLWSNAEDLAKLVVGLQGILSGSDTCIAGSALALEMTTGVIPEDGPIEIDPELKARFSNYGLGIGVEEKGGHRYIMHDGAWVGFNSFLITNELGQGAVILANGDSGDKLIPELVQSIAKAFTWPSSDMLHTSHSKVRPGEVSPTAIVPSDWIVDLEGEYCCGEDKVILHYESGKVFADRNGGKARGGETLELIPLGNGVAGYPIRHMGPHDVCRFTKAIDGRISFTLFKQEWIRPPRG
jgi:CubicO group peptidase (beta-lactamase class C family)